MHVTVEGVEAPKQAAFLEGISGDQAQGFYFGHPIPSTEITPDVLSKLQRAIENETTVATQQASG